MGFGHQRLRHFHHNDHNDDHDDHNDNRLRRSSDYDHDVPLWNYDYDNRLRYNDDHDNSQSVSVSRTAVLRNRGWRYGSNAVLGGNEYCPCVLDNHNDNWRNDNVDYVDYDNHL